MEKHIDTYSHVAAVKTNPSSSRTIKIDSYFQVVVQILEGVIDFETNIGAFSLLIASGALPQGNSILDKYLEDRTQSR